MNEDNKLERCYFCEVPYIYPSFFIHFENELFVCCESGLSCEFMINKLNTIKESEECPICLETKRTIELPTCDHRVCLECCKTIYFGKSEKKNIPIHPNEINFNTYSSKWPYEILAKDEENNEDEENDEKFIKYSEFFNKYFNFNFYDERIENYEYLLKIRDKLIPKREDWMNTEIFLNYENKRFKEYFESEKAEKEWEKYYESKIRCNETCPFCRSKPCDWW